MGQLLHRMGADGKLWKSYDGKTWVRDFLSQPRMPPVPGGTFVRKAHEEEPRRFDNSLDYLKAWTGEVKSYWDSRWKSP